ncbi:HpcH/HpaI aldolase/citrate lyase family protein [Parasedimentitalea psychrophila]|uniref:CoA ester lyase n=1 Tax=Parasedimentitalea psychrophila TaxID=2997337 RepID=A0A9Y2L088_9RHOB|nr:CoA ester lyase [Parasedimentitalea psychrophila]WIY25167.1 CoA ester lyase [Parasedimentitalea psychrophila]
MSGLTTARSLLFVPADRPERFDKALASGADGIIVDLEDAVAPAAKAAARVALAHWLDRAKSGHICLRINDATHVDHPADIALASHPRVDAVMLPKVDSTKCCASVGAATGKPVLALIETAKGVIAANEIAAAPAVSRLVLGTIDLALDLGIDGDTAHGISLLDHARATLTIASRAAGICAPVDGVHSRIDDCEGLRQACARAHGFGFTGMLAIHPRQIAAIHQAFRPTSDQVAWAQRVLDTAATNRGAFRLEGQMIDTPVIAQARRTLERARQ